MQNKKTLKILNGIISKGGLMAGFAKLYLNDEAMTRQFIIECSEQWHQELALEYWGNKLVLDIIKYGEQFNVKGIYNNVLINKNWMSKIKSVILIDNCEIDNFINHQLLEYYGVSDIRTFKKANEALIFLNETAINYQFIFIGIYMPMMNGFEFIDEFQKLDLHKKHGEIILLSAFFSPDDIEIAYKKKIKYIDKPLTIEEILKSI